MHYREIAEANLGSMAAALTRYPGGFGYLLLGVDFIVGPVKELVIVGDHGRPKNYRIVKYCFSSISAQQSPRFFRRK